MRRGQHLVKIALAANRVVSCGGAINAQLNKGDVATGKILGERGIDLRPIAEYGYRRIGWMRTQKINECFKIGMDRGLTTGEREEQRRPFPCIFPMLLQREDLPGNFFQIINAQAVVCVVFLIAVLTTQIAAIGHVPLNRQAIRDMRFD